MDYFRNAVHAVAHEGIAADVDGDGDIDIVSKEWTSGSVYYLENNLK